MSLCVVQVWDMARQAVEHTFTHHTNKVQAVAWNPVETPVLLTGGFDRLAALVREWAPQAGAAEVRGVAAHEPATGGGFRAHRALPCMRASAVPRLAVPDAAPRTRTPAGGCAHPRHTAGQVAAQRGRGVHAVVAA